jgi:hypothetical protein
MTKLELAEPSLEPIALTPAKTWSEGIGPGRPRLPGADRNPNATDPRRVPGELLGRISIGRPACIRLDLANVDQDAQVFLAGKPGSTFWLLAISCSFRAVEKEPMETAWLQVSLSTVNPDGAAAPVAWSMEPTILDDAVQVTRTTKLDASLKLASDHVPIDIGPSSGREITRAYTERRPFLEALHEGTERPAWVFTRTPVTEIRGLHRLRTVVELAAGSVGQADISAGAILKLNRLGLFPYRVNLDQVPDSRTVRIGPGA